MITFATVLAANTAVGSACSAAVLQNWGLQWDNLSSPLPYDDILSFKMYCVAINAILLSEIVCKSVIAW